MKLRKTMKAQSPKKKEKKRERNNNNKEKRKGSRLEDMQQKEHQGPRTMMCLFEALRRGPWLTHGKTKMYV